MYWVYILQSTQDNSFYIGCTGDINERIYKHNTGQSLATKRKRPWRLIYSEVFKNKTEALKRERKIKSYKGGASFKKLIT